MNQPKQSVPADLQVLLRQAITQQRQSEKTASGPVPDAVAGWLAAQYFARACADLAAPGQPAPWETLRATARDWSRFRRDDCTVARLQIARDRLALDRTRTRDRQEKEFRQWLKRPDIREELFPKDKGGLSPETIAKIEKELNLL